MDLGFGGGRYHNKLVKLDDWSIGTEPGFHGRLGLRSNRFYLCAGILETHSKLLAGAIIPYDMVYVEAGVNILPAKYERWQLVPTYRLGKCTGFQTANEIKAYKVFADGWGAAIYYKFRPVDVFVKWVQINYNETVDNLHYPDLLYESRDRVWSIGVSLSLKTFRKENWKN